MAPSSEDEVIEAVCEAAKMKTPLEIVSGGTKRDFGRLVKTDTVLDAGGLSGIVKYEPEELVLTARAGTPIAEIEAVLAEKNQMLGFEPADWGLLFGVDGTATLGGVVSTNACGPRRVKAGAVRDHVIGCRFVNGRGEAIKAGGHVIKNVTGFDVPKLMCGAFGTLGVLTEVTLRVTPAPGAVLGLAIKVDNAEDGLSVLRISAGLAIEPSGLAFLPAGMAPDDVSWHRGAAVIRVEGTAAAVEEKLEVLRNRFADRDVSVLDDGRTRALFRNLGDGAPLASRETDIWRLCLPATEAPTAVAAAAARYWYADWAGGLLWLGMPATEASAKTLRGLTARYGGHATLMRGSAMARAVLDVFEPEISAHAEITRAVKAAFDPKRVLNPGRMFQNV